MKPFRFLLFTLLAALASCSDGIEDVAPAITSYTGLALAVPQVTVSSASKTMNATEEECTANDLYLFCFPVGGDGKRHSQELNPVTAQKDLNGDASLYNIILQPGTYHVYVVANMGDKVIDTDGTKFNDAVSTITEEQLNELPLTYDAASLPTAGNIPMVYSDKNVVVYNGKATEVAANLTFTCAKVVVNIIFDPDNTNANIKAKTAFNGINWLLTGISGKNITTSTNLFTASPSSESDAMSLPTDAGSFYDGYDYNEAYQDVTNKDVVTPSGTAVAKPTDARKWLYRATYYLPERSVTDVNKATALPVTGKIIGGKEYTNTYNNISGGNLSTQVGSNYKLERGHYYEIVSFVNGLGQYGLPTTVDVEDWTPAYISADFLHTTLWVEKTQICTEAPLTTLTTATMTYKTNALPKDISVGCDTKVGDKPVISCTNDVNKMVLTFTVNPNIPFSSYSEDNKEGTAKVWIQAGNIKKYIDVYYSAEPFLIVTPQQEVIYWTNDANEASTLIKTLTFKTNLGGIKFQSGDFYTFNGNATGGVLSYGNSKVLVNCTSNTGATGTITVKAQDDPVTTTEHTFKVLPLADSYKSYAKEVKVTVKPAKGKYRIYMRAINDLQWYNGGTSSNEWSDGDFQAENYTKTGTTGVGNWRDGWFAVANVPWTDDAKPEYHYAYVYTQIGETKVATDKGKMPMWRFSKAFPGDQLTADGNNPGWYYIDEREDKDSEYTNNSGTKKITPGQTLIIFSNNTNVDKGYTLHRFTHHLEPGIPLFNFDDKEGWYLYDPLCDPDYRVFDDKPKVEDITYVIYTKAQVTGWYHKYGVGDNTTTPTEEQMFKIHSDHVTSEKSGNWYMTTLKFKCPHGYYEKAIKLKLEGVTDEPVLLGGASWTPSSDNTITGYYENGSWNTGKPTGAAKRRR